MAGQARRNREERSDRGQHHQSDPRAYGILGSTLTSCGCEGFKIMSVQKAGRHCRQPPVQLSAHDRRGGSRMAGFEQHGDKAAIVTGPSATLSPTALSHKSYRPCENPARCLAWVFSSATARRAAVSSAFPAMVGAIFHHQRRRCRLLSHHTLAAAINPCTPTTVMALLIL